VRVDTGSEKAVSSGLISIKDASRSYTETKNNLKLQKACQDFEAVFLSIIWNSMSKASGLDLGGWDVIAQEAIGKKWAYSGGIGLAKVLFRSLSKSSQ